MSLSRESICVERIILDAKLGSARKDAQIDACEPFAAALYDVIVGAGISASVWCATFHVSGRQYAKWAHAVVKVGDVFYDSRGRFDHDLVRSRQRIHPTVETDLRFCEDVRDFDVSDWSEMHAFCVKALTRALKRQIKGLGASDMAAAA